MNRESWFPDSYNRCLENFLQALVPQIINRLKDQPQTAKVSAAVGLLRLICGTLDRRNADPAKPKDLHFVETSGK